MEAVTHHAEVVALLRAHLSPAMAALFARPKPFDGGVEWYSDLSGQPLPFTSLPAAEAARIQHLLQERLASIRQLADRLERDGISPQQAALLRRAARDPDPASWYALNGQPVLTTWGPEPPPVEPAPVSATVDLPPAPPLQPSPLQPPAPRRRGCLLWALLVLLLLALLAGLLWWLLCPLAREPIPEPEPKSEPAPAPCVEKQQKEPPELVLVVDASLSMEFSMALDPKKALAMFYGGGQSCFDPGARSKMEKSGLGHVCTELLAPPRRMSLTKEAARSVLQKLPAEVGVGLVLIEDCPSARAIGFYPPARRADMLQQMDAIRSVGGTPLADGIAKAGAMLDGVNRDGLILVISDGEESCEQSPCAVAAQLAATKPRVKINVVDIANVGAGNCLASATGGKVFPATEVNQIASSVEEAMQEAMRDLIESVSCAAPPADAAQR